MSHLSFHLWVLAMRLPFPAFREIIWRSSSGCQTGSRSQAQQVQIHWLIMKVFWQISNSWLMSQVKYQHLPAPSRAATKHLTLETEVQTMRKWQNRHWLFIGVICSQRHINPSKDVAGQVAGLHIIFKSPSNMHQASVHVTSMSPFEEFHKEKGQISKPAWSGVKIVLRFVF